MEEFEGKFIRPIRNASYPATLAALSLTGARIGVSGRAGVPTTYTFLLAAAAFLVSAFSLFFYSLYPTRKPLWSVSAIAFLVGLLCLITSVFLLIYSI
jgi:hypothetical protein